MDGRRGRHRLGGKIVEAVEEGIEQPILKGVGG
jgi:hypothetical protein